jgi:hypothetical protein
MTPHDHAASERRRTEDEHTHALSQLEKCRQEVIVLEGALRVIAANPLRSESACQQMAKDGIAAVERMRKP